jgi:hypothetical protein
MPPSQKYNAHDNTLEGDQDENDYAEIDNVMYRIITRLRN